MFKLIWRLARDKSAQSIVELAVALPVLMVILCGILDFGWFFTNQLTISYLSREGARYGIVHATDLNAVSLISERVLSVAPYYIQSQMTVDSQFSDQADPRSGDITVNISCNVAALTPLTGIFVHGSTVILNSKCVMKVE